MPGITRLVGRADNASRTLAGDGNQNPALPGPFSLAPRRCLLDNVRTYFKRKWVSPDPSPAGFSVTRDKLL